MSAGHGRRNVERVTSAELLTDMFGRIREIVHGAVDGLTEDQLAQQTWPEWSDRLGYHDATHVRTVEYVSGGLLPR